MAVPAARYITVLYGLGLGLQTYTVAINSDAENFPEPEKYFQNVDKGP